MSKHTVKFLPLSGLGALFPQPKVSLLDELFPECLESVYIAEQCIHDSPVETSRSKNNGFRIQDDARG